MSKLTESFPAYLTEWRAEVDEAIAARELRSADISPTATRAAFGASESTDDLHAYLYGPLEHFVAAGGKRIRPILCLMACEIAGGDPRKAMSTACAIESFQSAALIHDDIADAGEMRRGEPCVHITEGVGIAVNTGDLGILKASTFVAEDESLSVEIRLALLREIDAMICRTVEGQALDMGWARDERWDITPENYLEVGLLKTAHYSCASPLACGAIVAQAPQHIVEGLRSFGLRAGLAFQIQDDLLNITGDAQALGKDFRTDITEGKRTLVVVETLRRLQQEGRDETRQEFISLLAGHTEDAAALAHAVDIMQDCGAVDAARKKAEELTAQAKAEVEDLGFSPSQVRLLHSMADFFVNRAG